MSNVVFDESTVAAGLWVLVARHPHRDGGGWNDEWWPANEVRAIGFRQERERVQRVMVPAIRRMQAVADDVQ